MPEKIDCPSHLLSVKNGSIHSIVVSNDEIIATIYIDGNPNKKLLITNDTLNKIKSVWDNEEIVLLHFDSGTIRKDEVLVPSSIIVQSDENENPTFM